MPSRHFTQNTAECGKFEPHAPHQRTNHAGSQFEKFPSNVVSFPTPMAEVSPSDRKYLTDAEVEALIKAAEGTRNPKRDVAMLLLMSRHGLRCSEATMLKMAHIDIAGESVWIQRLKHGHSNQRGLDPDEVKVLKAWFKCRDRHRGAHLPWVFLSERGGQLSRFTINSLVRTLGERIGLPTSLRHPHALRHTTATHLARQGRNAHQIKRHLGHRTLEMSTCYIDLSQAPLEKNW